MPVHAQFFKLPILTTKVGQIDLVIGVWSEFITLALMQAGHGATKQTTDKNCSIPQVVQMQKKCLSLGYRC